MSFDRFESCSTGDVPPTVGTSGPDIIIATAVSGATIYGIAGNDVLQCGAGDCKIDSGNGDNTMIARDFFYCTIVWRFWK